MRMPRFLGLNQGNLRLAKGGFYFHFASKEAVFEAVFEVVSLELLDRISAIRGKDILDSMVAGSRAYFDACAEPAIGRIILKDGPAVLAVSCQDTYGQSTSASIVLEVIAPGGPTQPDTFAGVLSGNIFAGTWTTYSVQGAGGCSIQQANASGLLVTLNPGGTPSGSASSGFLSPSGDPYTFSLICSGAPANVPGITVSP